MTEEYICDPEMNDPEIQVLEKAKDDFWDEPRPKPFRELFEDLREEKFATIEGNACCTGCSASALSSYSETLDEVCGYAYYHIQSIDGLGVTEPSNFDFDRVPVYYGADDGAELSAQEVGELIVGLMNERGIEWEWDGNPDLAIFAEP